MPEFVISQRGAVETWAINAEARRNTLSQAMVRELEEHATRQEG